MRSEERAGSPQRLPTLTMFVLVLAAIVLAAGLLWGLVHLLSRLRAVLTMVLISVVLAYLLHPLVEWMCRLRVLRALKFSRFGATLVAFALLTFVLIMAGLSMGERIAADVQGLKAKWPRYQQQLPKAAERFKQWYEWRVPAGARQVLDQQWARMRQQLAQRDWASALIGATLGGLGFLVELLLVPILTFYFLSDLPKVKEAFLFFVPDRYRAHFNAGLTEADVVFRKFIVGQVILCLIAFVVVTVALWAMKMEFHLVLGLWAGITRAIPIIGPIIGGLVIVGVALFSKGLAVALWLLLGFTLLHFIESKFVMPLILGFQVGVHPVLIIIALLVGGEFFGIIGMFLAVPVLAVVYRLVAYYRAAKGEAAAGQAAPA